MNKRCRWAALFWTVAMLMSAKAWAAEVARVNGVVYETLQEAFDAAVPGTPVTVELLADITTDVTVGVGVNQEITLDMKRHAITVPAGFTGRPIRNDGTLTITGDGVIDASASSLGGYGAVDNYGKLVIESGTFTGSVHASGAAIKNRPGGEVTVYDGLFNGAVTAVYNAGVTRIYDGVFDCRSCSSCDSNSWGYTIQSHQDVDGMMPSLYFYNGTVIGVQGAFSSSAGYTEIHDGTFETVACQVHTQGNSAYYALYIAGESGEVECHVYGGTFRSASRVAAYIGNNVPGDGGDRKNAIAYFHGGTFQSGNPAQMISVDNQIGGLEIDGGTFLMPDGSVGDVKQWTVSGFEQNPDGSVRCAHTGVTHVSAVAAECETPGNIEYWHCGNCGLYFADAALKTPIALQDTVLPATGHSYQNGVCSVCGEGTPIELPRTGDEGRVLLWLSLMLVSACGMAVLALERRGQGRTR